MVVDLLSLSLLLVLLTCARNLAFLLLMHDQSGPGLLFIPFETCQDGQFQFVILLFQTNIVISAPLTL